MEPATGFAGCWMLDGMRGDDEREKMDFQPEDMTPS
jgi:hypothetical protein